VRAKNLSKTNAYLKNKTTAKRHVARSVASSTAIETGEAISKIEAKLKLPAAKREKLA
jgi:hypothetical protein